jgi:glycyl-tRNA synthetase beta subunit
MPDFLLEIGCEEIPARMIDAASRELRERVNALLQRERLEPAGRFRISTRRAGWPFSLPAFPLRSPTLPSR